MKTKIALLALLFLTGCGREPGNVVTEGGLSVSVPRISKTIGNTSNSRIERFHDEELSATCWVIDGYRQMSCIPDTMLVRRKGTAQ